MDFKINDIQVVELADVNIVILYVQVENSTEGGRIRERKRRNVRAEYTWLEEELFMVYTIEGCKSRDRVIFSVRLYNQVCINHTFNFAYFM